jgi:SAM-dependent methyltransferase
MAAPPEDHFQSSVSWVDHTNLGTAFAIDESASCEICGSSSALFKDYNARPKALCNQCGAAERQRVLARLYRDFIRHEYPLTGKRILSVAPAASERTFLKSLFPSDLLFVDIRPDTGPDKIADICAMPEIPSGGFDAVVASGVLSFVHDFDAALNEIHRVLSEGGVFLHCEVNYGFNQRTEELANQEKIAAWCGREALEKKKVGLFRKLGDLDFNAALQQLFVVKMFYGRDSANGMTVAWHCAVKRSDIVKKPSQPQPAAGFTRQFVTPLPDGFPGLRTRLELSVPDVPLELKYSAFAEHVVSQSPAAKDEVVLLGKGVIGVSRDQGANWEVIKPEGLGGIEFDQCFTTRSGMHIVQTIGWRAASEFRTNPDDWGRVLVFDPEWRLIDDNRLGDSSWHGSMSIDESGGVLMFAEYPANLALFRADERDIALSGGAGAEFLRPSRVHRSLDGGATWQIVFEMPPSEIRHFHCIVADQFTPGTWWLASGDLPRECRIWRTQDHGGTWCDVTDPAPAVPLPPRFETQRQASHRLTSMIVREHDLIWGGDDIMAPYWTAAHADLVKKEAGAWLFSSPKSGPLSVKALAYLGQPARTMTDVGPGWIMTSEAVRRYATLSPQVFFVAKSDPSLCVEIARLSNHAVRGTSLSYSRASRIAAGGVFFSHRLPTDEFETRPNLLKWRFSLDS